MGHCLFLRKGGEWAEPTPSNRHIYGVEWDGSSTTKWTRTDEAVDFADPVPYVKGANVTGSPFDNLQPWAGMMKSERIGGIMVSIPKFWYKLTQNGIGMKIQIATYAANGFQVSPAHMDRGDGKGERDVVYIGRYCCGTTNYQSVTGQIPIGSITRSSARINIHALGQNIWQFDFILYFTLWLLYLVEFADWDSQLKIGYGCGYSSTPQNMGYTDSMPYHTGTMQSSRTTFGLGIQYRNIEGLWDNCFVWCDGCYNDNNGLNIIVNPNNFSDNANGVFVGKQPLSGFPSAFTVKTATGLPTMFIPTSSGGSVSTYSCDTWSISTSDYPCVSVGGGQQQSLAVGLFYVANMAVLTNAPIFCCRLQELP